MTCFFCSAVCAIAHGAGHVQHQNHRCVRRGRGLGDLLLCFDLQSDIKQILLTGGSDGLADLHLTTGRGHSRICCGLCPKGTCLGVISIVDRGLAAFDLLLRLDVRIRSKRHGGQQAQGHDQSQQQRQYTFLCFCHFSFSFLCRGTKYLAVGRAWRFRFSFLTLRPALSDGLPFHYFLFRWRGALSPRSVLRIRSLGFLSGGPHRILTF